MYVLHFGLREPPFSLAPDPRYLYLSDGHREALAHLLYGLGEGGGFVQLTGEVGTGKTTVCRTLLDQLPPEVDVAMIFNPRLTSLELIASVCDELRVGYQAGTTSVKVLVDALSRALLEAHGRGRRTVLIIDEAQNLSMEVLEELRLLTNLETTRQKLLQVVLIGQPELAEVLQRPQLRQLAQRVTARYHLRPFSAKETRAYVQHRMSVAGQPRPLFTPGALRLLHRRSGGVPRLINSLCDRALLGAYVESEARVTTRVMRRAAVEVLGRRPRPRSLAAAAAAVVVLAGTLTAAALGAGRLTRIATDWVAAVRPALSAVPPQAPGVAAPQPPRPGLIALLDRLPASADKEAAFSALYAQWGIEYRAAPGAFGCEYGRPAGLRCVWRAGTSNVLRRLDLPAILTLTMPAGERRYAVLTALAGASATIVVGGESVTLPFGDIERVWDGEFVALWRPPVAHATALKPGMGGADVVWLRHRLGEVDGVSAVASRDVIYDDELKRRVVAFQRAHALTPDGIVGEETLLRLVTTAPDATTPSLSAGRR